MSKMSVNLAGVTLKNPVMMHLELLVPAQNTVNL